MLMEIMYQAYTATVQRVASISGYDINGLLVYMAKEDDEVNTYVTVRTGSNVLVERIKLSYLKQISDFNGGNGDDNTANSVGMTYIDLGLVHLADNEELTVIFDCDGVVASNFIGCAALIEDLPKHDEQQFHYQLHTDTSFTSDSVCALYTFLAASSSTADLVNVKLGGDARSTTVRAANWFANLLGKIELDNTTLGVVFDNAYGQNLSVNHSTSGLVCVLKRVVQPDNARSARTTRELAQTVARKVTFVDRTSQKAAATQA